MSLLNFNAQGVPPATGEQEPIPAGWYDVAMDQSEMKPTKDAATTGNAFLECRFNVLSGQYAGRKLFARINLRNNNPVAAEIAQKELSAICHAVNVLMVQDSQQLHGIPLKVKVKVRPAEGQYGPNNDITTYKPANFVPEQTTAPAVPGMPAMAPGAVPPAAGAQPWQQPPQQFAPPPQQQFAPPPQFAPPQQPQFAQPGAGAPPQGWQAPQGAPQPWQQPGMQPAAAPMAPPVQQQPQAPMQQPQAPQQYVQQPQQPGPGALPPGANPQGAMPPWQTPPAQ